MKKNMIFAISTTAIAAMLLAGCGASSNNASQGSVVPQTGSAAEVSGTKNLIGEDKAKKIALKSAGKDEADVTQLQVYLDDGQGDEPTAYDVEFVVDDQEYDYEIDASTGDILSQDSDTIKQKTAIDQNADGYITKAKAKKIALKNAGLKASEVSAMHVTLDLDDDDAEPAVYDVEFYAGNIEYDYEIDASTGEIRSTDQDAEGIISSDMAQTADNLISASKAENKALKHAGLQKNKVTGLYAELDFDDGISKYEVEFYHNGMEYSYEINAESGKVISYESDYDD